MKSILDVPCGDWNWLQHVNLEGIDYIGGDIVQVIIERNAKEYGKPDIRFERLDIINGSLPKADLILCRDCLVHLSFTDGLAAIETFRESGARWLLTTTFTDRESNAELYEGQIWRTLNLGKAPYNFPVAERYINEGCTEGEEAYGDKCLALWHL